MDLDQDRAFPRIWLRNLRRSKFRRISEAFDQDGLHFAIHLHESSENSGYLRRFSEGSTLPKTALVSTSAFCLLVTDRLVAQGKPLHRGLFMLSHQGLANRLRPALSHQASAEGPNGRGAPRGS